jgi:hypothetical protein
MCVCFELPVTVEKTRGTMNRAGGRERPHELFGRLKAEKVGSLPPDLVFFHGDFLFPRFRIAPVAKDFGFLLREEVGSREGAHGNSYLRHPDFSESTL